MALESLRERLDAVMKVGAIAAPKAALAISKTLQGKVSAARAAAKRRRRAERATRKSRGDTRRVPMGVRRGSGVKILAVGTGSAIVVTASTQVQKIARDRDEIGEWTEILREQVDKAWKVGS